MINNSALSISQNSNFTDIISIIEKSRETTFRAINSELISMYWLIGQYISEKTISENWGKSVVVNISNTIQSHYVGIRGFSPQNLWRMVQFYETYANNEKLSTLSREIPWSQNMLILTAAKTDEAREFYLQESIKNRYSFRELERQINSMLFERTMLSNHKHHEIITKNPSLALFRDSYVLEFLDIPDTHSEKDLQKSIVSNLKDFILEFGRDFTFVGQEYKVQVGKSDFYIDLLFYNRALSCLVAIELKIGEFQPEHIGQIQFYLEALDRDVKKEHENPSVGLVLCTYKDDTIVEYAMSRTLSPAMVANYNLHLPDKHILENKLRELAELTQSKE
ncbi:MAG: PDDEXK nuclease domain-containing protein [Alphaproteobacteria bacterium]|jgi:predicted nuclease of restriction endonuclease-like (RecB) superfamily|nr:PDDEXK nuclease domain-containing protein [Alphaproteobacteria bacterium]